MGVWLLMKCKGALGGRVKDRQEQEAARLGDDVGGDAVEPRNGMRGGLWLWLWLCGE